ncbi:MAG: ATP-binding protein [Saprospiraceae bacterium]
MNKVLQKVLTGWYLIGLCLLYNSPYLNSQPDPAVVDSLEQLLQTDLEDTTRMDVLVTLGKKIARFNFEQSEKYLREYAELAEQSKDITRRVDAKFTLATFHDIYGIMDSVEVITKEGLELIAEADNENLTNVEGMLLVNLGNVASHNKELSKALEYYFAGAEKLERGVQQNVVRYNIAEIYHALGNESEGMEIYTEVKEFGKKNKVPSLEAMATSSIAEVYVSFGEYEKAINYYREAIELTDQYGSEIEKMTYLNSIANVYGKTDIPKSIVEYKLLLDKSMVMENESLIAMNLESLIQAYQALGNMNKALEYANRYYQKTLNAPKENIERNQAYYYLAAVFNTQKEYKKALNYAYQAIEGCDLGNQQDGAFYLDVLLEYAHALQFTGNAAEAWKTFSLRDSLITERNTTTQKTALAGAEVKYRLQERETAFQQTERENELQIAKATNRQNLFLSLFIGTTLILLVGFFFYNRLRQAKQTIEEQRKIVETTLIEKDAVKTRFFSNISHELRTPLTLMLGPINSVLRANQINNRDVTLLKMAEQSGQQLLRLVNSILDFSRLEITKLKLQESSVVLFPLVRRLVSQFESSAQIQDVELNFDYQLDPYLELKLDVSKFEIIINNLLSNALKFTSKGEKIAVQIQDLQNRVSLTVSDTGRGIHPDDLPHIFDRFYQTQEVYENAEGGSGIGLALSQEYAQLFTGKLTVESTLGSGSIFNFTFPKKEVLRAPDIPAIATEEASIAAIDDLEDPVLITSLAATNRRSRILLVEDNHSLRSYIQLILNPNYEVLIAVNGQVAWDLLSDPATPSLDLIISDVMMPYMDGFTLLEKIKANDQWRSTPFVMLTARSAQEDRLKGLTLGIDDYITKPFNEEELLVRINNLLQNAFVRQQISLAARNDQDILQPKKVQFEPVTAASLIWMEEVAEHIKADISNTNFSVSILADKMALSERQFIRRIKQIIGMGPGKYIKEIKLQRARFLLEEQVHLSVAEVCYAVGFSTPAYFSKIYRERFGKLPSDYLDVS